ncbi:MAG TPA: hypothetical protein VKU77_37670 [Streptosporangiaceae bacterium]|nr:hypothetical protein [Streptosporangiaceae bacterium]
MASGELRSGHADTAPGWVARVTVPRVLIVAAGALVLTDIPLSGYRNDGHIDFVWVPVGVLLAVWQLWDHSRIAWALLTVTTAAALGFYGLSIAGVITIGLPGWWFPLAGAADIAALLILLSRPIRRWVGGGR